MLKTFLILLGSAAAVDLRQNSEYTRNGLALLRQEINKVSLPGAARQIAIDALLKSVEGSDKISPESIEVLNNVTVLLNGILDVMRAQTITAQAEIDNVQHVVGVCNDAGDDSDALMSGDVQTKNTTHAGCRDEEKVLFDDDADKCAELTAWLDTLSAPNCVKPGASQENIDQWTSFLSLGLGWFEVNKEQFVPKRDACTNTTDLLEDKNTECANLQTGFESAWCQWSAHREEQCSTLASCWSNAVAHHNTLQAAKMDLAGRRMEEAKMILHVICLIERLVAGQDLDNYETDCPIADNSQLTEFQNTEVTPDEQDSCVLLTEDFNYDWLPDGLSPKTPSVDCGEHNVNYTYNPTPARRRS